jgi:hypothetical protein
MAIASTASGSYSITSDICAFLAEKFKIQSPKFKITFGF